MASSSVRSLSQPKPVRSPMARPGFGTRGQRVPILANHFKANANFPADGFFSHYSVALFYEDGRPVEGKGAGRRIIDKVYETYSSELNGKEFAYDGESSLFTIGSLPQTKLEFTVVLEDVTSSRNTGNGSPGSSNQSDRKRMKRPYRSKTYKVVIKFAAKIPMQEIANALRGHESEKSQEALRVLDIILRQHAAKQGCLLVRQSFFHDNPRKPSNIGGGVLGYPGFHSSFRTTQSGLSLNMDVSTTLIVTPGPVGDFLIANQKVRDLSSVNWKKAARTLKNLRVKTIPSNQEFKITGLSDETCKRQTFTLKKSKDDEGEEVTVYDYFVNTRGIKLRHSGDLPCINVGKPKRPTYFPVELCDLVSLQRYTKALSAAQRTSLVNESRQRPEERKSTLSDGLRMSKYNEEPMLRYCGVQINSSFTQVESRILPAPKLKGGNSQDLFARNGRWNFNNKKLFEASEIADWIVVNFSTHCDIEGRNGLIAQLINVGNEKGIRFQHPKHIFHERLQYRDSPLVRVEKMVKEMESKFNKPPEFFLCLLPERKTCPIYGPWKRMIMSKFGVITQCASPQKIDNQYVTNLLLKINAKLGGLNSMLASEMSRSIPMVSTKPTLILGMDVSHGSPGQADSPSIAAVVSSMYWPSVSRYRASVRTQPPKVEMIDSLFQPVPDNEKEDDGIFRECLMEFYYSSKNRKPDHIIIFRDGVSESQFNQVLNVELSQIIEACKRRDETWNPKFVVIVAQKNHHTRFFKEKPLPYRESKSPDNVAPGTVIDNTVCHPRNYDFYLCAHAGMIGTTRPTHYHVLLDQVGFSADDLQELVHSLSYVYQRSTTAISVVAPICYAHLAAAQLGQWIDNKDMSESSSIHSGSAAAAVPPMPKLKGRAKNSMFFC